MGQQIEADRTELFKREYLPQVKPFPKLRELFERLRRDEIEIGLASSAKDDELQAYKKITGIGPYLSTKASSDDAPHSKPDPDIFLAARKKLGIDPRNIIAVGDTPYDAESADKAGMATIGLLCGGSTAAQLRAAGCVALYKDPADLLMKYDNSPLASSGARRTDGNYRNEEQPMNSSNTLYFLLGVGIGAVAGILYAPKSGGETRDLLKRKSAEGASYVKQTASDAVDAAQQKADELGKTGAETIAETARTVKAPLES